MSEPELEVLLVGHRALTAVPIVVVDALAAWWLLRVSRRRDAQRFLAASGAFDLGLFFFCLALVAIGQVLTHSLLDQHIAFFFNHGLQSASVILSAVPLVRFSHRLVVPMFPREARIVETVVLVVALVASAVYARLPFLQPPLVFDVTLELSRLPPDAERPWSLFITSFLLLSYGYALVVLLRKARVLEAASRRIAHSFAVIVFAAICAVIINRLESIELLPIGTYTTYMLWVTLAALLLFLVATDEITQFRDRIAALVVVGMLGAVSIVMLEATDALGQNAEQQRAELLARARVTTGAIDGHVLRELTADDVVERMIGSDPRTAVLTAVVIHEGARFAVSSPYIAHRRVVDDYARRAAVLVVLSMVLALLIVPRVAEWSVLRPLARFVRAEAESREKSVFLAGMSHELRTPLSAISHHASRLVDDPSSQDDVRSRAAEIEDASNHLLSLIETLLLAGRHDVVAPTPRLDTIALSSVLEPVLSNHRPVANKKGLVLSAYVADDVGPTIVTDARVLRQILSNLVGNALKFTELGSVIIEFVRAGEHDLRMTVVDTGRGIPADALTHVFEPFFQHDPKDGVGLGLSLVRTLVDAMCGTFDLESEVGAGTRATVTLPNALATKEVTTGTMPSDATALLHQLSPEVRAELAALARVGDVVRLRDRVQSIAESGCDPRLVDLLEAHLRRYQLRALRTMLEAPISERVGQSAPR
jgi:signal transduction histidine kinase